MITVVKFGGSSVANCTQFEKVKNIVLSDDKRRIVVVSAPGKRFSGDSKITDLLYLLSSHIKYNVDFTNIYNNIYDRYEEIRSGLNINFDLKKEFEEIKANLKKGATEAYIVSRGEYLCAKLMASYLGFTFVDSTEMILFNYDGSLNYEKTAEKVKEKYAEYNCIVVPGFYGAYPSGEVKLFTRGGSDITGSVMAMGVNAEIYENWTDVSGLLVADPRVIDNPKGVEEITYDELRELSYMGASVLHEETIFPIRELDIPINILNTNRPQDKGTIICKNSDKKDSFITGIAGKKNFKAFTIVKNVFADKLTVIRDVLNVFDKFKVSVEHIPTAIDSFSVVVDGKSVEKSVFDIITELKKINGVISVDIDNDLALVAVVGRNMALKAGVSGALFSVFGRHKINIKTIAQGTREINIIVGVANEDFEKSIRAIYQDIVIEEKY